MNDTPMRYGAGRLDAVGHILNKVLMFSGASIEEGNRANAPVSYPFLRDIWQQEKVQWNGVAENNFVGIRRLPEIDRAPDPFDPRGNERTLCLTTPDVEILACKARPLDGIWATAPCLHNGSVRSLYELLLPAEERSPTFAVGSREYDPIDVGYVATEADGRPDFVLDTGLEGNRNSGHEYGVAGLDEAERRALVEYTKTL